HQQQQSQHAPPLTPSPHARRPPLGVAARGNAPALTCILARPLTPQGSTQASGGLRRRGTASPGVLVGVRRPRISPRTSGDRRQTPGQTRLCVVEPGLPSPSPIWAGANHASVACVSAAPPTFYEFFAGGGMARLGLGARWSCAFANDFDPVKAAAYRANFADAADHFHE